MGDPPCPLMEMLGISRDAPAWLSWEKNACWEKKEYPDVHFYSIRSKAISFQWTPEPDPSHSQLVAIDVYNGHTKWGVYPHYPIDISNGEKRLSIHPTTKALEFVQVLGEPTRKGGGASMGGPAMWMEWTCSLAGSPVYIQVEFAGTLARSADRWERGQGTEAVWGTVTLSMLPP